MKKGDLVKFIGCTEEQARWGSCDFPKDLIVDDFYRVERMEFHTWHAKVKLAGIDGWFNSVCFV